MICASTFWAITRICSRREVAVSKAGQGGGAGDHQGGRTGNAGARGRLGIRLHQQAFLGRKKLQQPGGQGEPKAAGAAQRFEAGKMLLAPRIYRVQVDALPFQRREAAGGEDVDRKIQRERPGMEQVQRPQIDGASRQISPAGGLGHDGRSAGRIRDFPHAVFYHETGFAGRWRGRPRPRLFDFV